MIAIIQARMSSKRLKGKVLKKIGKKILLDRVYENLKVNKNINKIIIATSKNPSDDKIFKFCKKRDIFCFRGDLNNVAKRYYDVLLNEKSKYFMRVTADSPFIDSAIIKKMLKISKTNKYEIITNVCPRSFPKGQTVEIFKSKTFKDFFSKIKTKSDKEHVTTFFYKNKKKFKLKNIFYKKNFSKMNLSVDTEDDLKRSRKIEKIINKKYGSDFSLKNLIREY